MSRPVQVLVIGRLAEARGLLPRMTRPVDLRGFVADYARTKDSGLVVVDRNEKILAGVVQATVGTVFTRDAGNEVARTIEDGKTRTSIAVSRDNPKGLRQVTVPIRNGSGAVGSIARVMWENLGLVLDSVARRLRGVMANLHAEATERDRAERALEQSHDKLTVWVGELELHAACVSEEKAHVVVARSAAKLFPDWAGALYGTTSTRLTFEAAASWGSDSGGENWFAPDDCWAVRSGLKAAHMCIPLAAQSELIGILYLQRPDDCGVKFDKRERELATTISEHVALAPANIALRDTLREQSTRDPLTGLYNRRYLEDTLDREIRRANRNNTPVGIAMIDIDHFKRFNDTYGHEAGHVLLRELGRLRQTSIRTEDIACRFGGEEFVLTVPGASLEDTRKRAERVRSRISAVEVPHQEQRIGNVSISGGVAVFPDDGQDGHVVLETADAAMYRAKRAGRNRIVAWSKGFRREKAA